MRRVILTVIGLLNFLVTVSAQEQMLTVQGVAPDLYINHNTLPRQNYYSIGRMYNIPPKDIAAYNKLIFENGLNLGQTIKIPLSQNNFVQSVNTGDKSLLPVYHEVAPKEGLYRISVNYNKVPLDHLKRWNNLSSDVVSNGTNLIVGYLKLAEASSVSQNTGNTTQPIATTRAETPVPVKTNIPKEIIVEKKPEVTETSVAETPSNTTVAAPSQGKSALNFNGGAFKKLYEDQHLNKTPYTESGLSGVFKSTSGWRDGKYYCFHNSAPPGTILKITNSINGRSIYAKVLDLIPDITQNTGLILHVSNAAAEDLGIGITRFDCSINYTK